MTVSKKHPVADDNDVLVVIIIVFYNEDDNDVLVVIIIVFYNEDEMISWWPVGTILTNYLIQLSYQG